MNLALISVYGSIVVTSALTVILFSMLFGGMPGKWYVTKIAKIQLIISSIIMVFSAYRLLISYIFNDRFQYIGTVGTFDSMFILAVVDVVIFLSSIYKYKLEGNIEVVEIEARKSEYKLKKDMDYLSMVNDIVNIKKAAVFSDKVILFTGSCPEKEVDITFYCKEVKPNIYSCISYEANEATQGRISRFSSWLTIIAFCCLPFAIIHADVTAMNTGVDISSTTGEVVMPLVSLILGCVLAKSANGIKGVPFILVQGLGIFLIITGLLGFI